MNFCGISKEDFNEWLELGVALWPDYKNKKGLAKELIKIAEQWSLKNGCKELGSDAELENINSQKFHKNLGFKEVNRTVNFIKIIDDGLQNIT